MENIYSTKSNLSRSFKAPRRIDSFIDNNEEASHKENEINKKAQEKPQMEKVAKEKETKEEVSTRRTRKPVTRSRTKNAPSEVEENSTKTEGEKEERSRLKKRKQRHGGDLSLSPNSCTFFFEDEEKSKFSPPQEETSHSRSTKPKRRHSKRQRKPSEDSFHDSYLPPLSNDTTNNNNSANSNSSPTLNTSSQIMEDEAFAREVQRQLNEPRLRTHFFEPEETPIFSSIPFPPPIQNFEFPHYNSFSGPVFSPMGNPQNLFMQRSRSISPSSSHRGVPRSPSLFSSNPLSSPSPSQHLLSILSNNRNPLLFALSLMNRDFNDGDYELLLRLDEGTNNRGAPTPLIESLPIKKLEAKELVLFKKSIPLFFFFNFFENK